MREAEYQFDRHCRTTHSEVFVIKRGPQETGRVDLHYGQNVVYGTLNIVTELDDEEVFQLIEIIDERLVLSADVVRDDFVVTVFRGSQVGVFSDDSFEDDEDDEDEEEVDGKRNGH